MTRIGIADRTAEAPEPDWHSANGNEIKVGWIADIGTGYHRITGIKTGAHPDYDQVFYVAFGRASITLLGTEDTLMATPDWAQSEFLLEPVL